MFLTLLLPFWTYSPLLPRSFIWLPHFFVEKLFCPKGQNCVLKKIGALRPRRVTDMEDSFYIVAWAYYCRQGCCTHFAGWNKSLISSLPAYLYLAFSAVFSHKGGLSNNVINQLRVGVFVPYSLRCIPWNSISNFLNIQRLSSNSLQLHAYITRKVPSFGNFSDP